MQEGSMPTENGGGRQKTAGQNGKHSSEASSEHTFVA